ncbi:RNA polymerase, sigma 32 subunit, RpoH [Geobacter metallireducens RCH3]|uniref:RNA polymerase sigma factor n=1 Tax=Geobacter metallireducens (strain ATCC 53774 / DSM 7210 / GS-15) TaxID=269799 RepID=Q39RQ2_GEOMG|nr:MULTISPECIES: RNA polymerase sigma factor RpoH [Geobacter]ABB33072.1 RNA polymerase sigma-32 factor RpoH [Geobacter metallireducens GS-15]EHP84233.1 RNA polymerase, sigma 32 subunit, RpoH [Geobacter metallireducens RCH3]MBT1077255.1 RNA polymerase sigma factor RpoH [Geobacter grbiciae]
MTMNLPVVADSFTLYLAEIRKFPVLTPEEEHLYAVKFYEEKDLEAAHRLITANLRFVVKVAAEYKSYGMKMLDLIQEGNIGLMMAVRKFDPHKGIRLISYAVWWIRAYIQNYIISAWSLLKIGTTQAQKKLFFKLNQAKNAIRRLTGGDDTEATALSLHVKESEVIEMDQRMRGDYSLDAELVDGEGLTMLDTLVDERQNQEEALAEQQEASRLHGQVTQALERLNEKERYVVENRVTADEPLTLQEIADHFAISRERVRQIEEGALKKIKAYLTPITV